MLNDYALGVLKANRINPDDVEYVDHSMLVTFKNGEQRRICEIYCRVMGYIRPSTEYNKGKHAEFETRKYFDEEKANKRMETIEG